MSYIEFVNLQAVDAIKIRDALAKDGAVVIRNVFTNDEIDRARSIVLKHLNNYGSRLMLGKTQPNAAIAVKQLGYLLADFKVIEIYKKIYGEKNVVFTSHCDVHMNMISGWHKDSGEHVGGYFKGDYFNSDDCKVYKTAIYLQDVDGNDGLTVRLKSHRSSSLAAGEERKLATKSGDIVVFDVRLNHIGRVPDAVEKFLKNISRLLNLGDRNKEDPLVVTNFAKIYGRLTGRKERLSIFFTYGYDNKYTYDFSASNMARQNQQSTVKSAGLPAELSANLVSQGVKIFKIEDFQV